jgi:hypothetical protein
MRRLYVLCMLLAFGGVSSECKAEGVSLEKSIYAAVNTLEYVRGVKFDGKDVNVAIVYDKKISKSQEEAQLVLKTLAVKQEKSRFTYHANMVAVDDVASLKNTQVLTAGVESHAKDIIKNAQDLGAVTISVNRACAEANCCMLAVEAGDSVNIYLNEHVMMDLGLDVDAAFGFMVKKV